MTGNNTNQNRINSVLQQFQSLSIQRYTAKDLPGYRHIPGMTPHPISDKNGHSYGKTNEISEPLSENNWQTNEFYLYAIDLFNYKYFWETHETLEDLWKLEENSNLKKFLQGIIQISAAYIKWIQGIDEGVKKLSFKAVNKLLIITESQNIFCGIDVQSFIDQNQRFLNDNLKKISIPPPIHLLIPDNDTLNR